MGIMTYYGMPTLLLLRVLGGQRHGVAGLFLTRQLCNIAEKIGSLQVYFIRNALYK